VPSDLYRFAVPDAEPVTLSVNGAPAAFQTVEGFARLRRVFRPGDVVTLHLPMPARRVLANPAVKNDAGEAALQRGPLVYCVESADNAGPLRDLALPEGLRLRPELRPDLLGGVFVLRGTLPAKAGRGERRLVAIPYASWANRGKGEMRVFVPVTR
jgi:uncharacterized protein